uniref:Cytochrome c oxidase assembly factor 3 n=1 Tax=Rhinopithecus roxellana TaxID=61622 RepID=A0A2K6R2J6_RHIRO
MAASGAGDPLDAKRGEAPFPQPQLAQWQKVLPRRRTRNIVTGLGIGALVLALYGYTFYSISQEHFLDELEDEAKAARARALARASGS